MMLNMVPIKWEVNLAKGREVHGESDMWAAQLNDIKRVKDLMLMLGLNELINQLVHGRQCALKGSCVEEGGWSWCEKSTRLQDWRSKVEIASRGDPKLRLRKKLSKLVCQSKCSGDVNQIAAGLRSIWTRSVVGESATFKTLCLLQPFAILRPLLVKQLNSGYYLLALKTRQLSHDNTAVIS